MWPFDGLGAQQPGASTDPNYFQRVTNILQAQRGGTPGGVAGILNPQPDLGRPNPGQYGPPAPGSQNNPLRPPGFDLGQPNPGQYGPPAPGSQNNPQGSLWSNLLGALGNMGGQLGRPGAMPGATIGAPAGSTPPAMPTVPPQFPGQMGPPPPTLASYFRQQQFPSNNNALMSQYMALQQMMRGS